MSVIIRLQNLPWSANANDIREFFKGLTIPEGGVHIVGGEMGDAFIAFGTDEDARLAMMKTGETLKSIQVTLHLSSRTQMQKVIETARQQALGMQAYMASPTSTSNAPAQPQFTQPQNQAQPMMQPQQTGGVTSGQPQPSNIPMGMDRNNSQVEAHSQMPPAAAPMYHNNPYNQQPFANQMGQYNPYGHPVPPQAPFDRDPQFAKLNMGMQPMNQMPGPYYGQNAMMPNQMARPMPPMQDQDMGNMRGGYPEYGNMNMGFNNGTNASPSSNQRITTPEEEKKDKVMPGVKMDKKDQNNDRKRRSRSKSRDRDRRRRHRSRSRSRSRDRGSRRRKSRSRERDRTRDKERRGDRDRDSRSRNNYRDRNDQNATENSENKILKPESSNTSGGIPGLGEIPDNIPKEGLSIFSKTGDDGPQVSKNDAGWPKRDQNRNNKQEFDNDVIMQDAFPMGGGSVTNAPANPFQGSFPPVNKLPGATETPATQMPFAGRNERPGSSPFDGRDTFNSKQNPPDNKNWDGGYKGGSRFDNDWNNQRQTTEPRRSKWDQPDRELPPTNMGGKSQWMGDSEQAPQEQNRGENSWGNSDVGGRGERTGFDFNRKENFSNDFNQNAQSEKPPFMDRPSGPPGGFGEDKPYSRDIREFRGRGSSRGFSGRGGRGRGGGFAPEGRERKQKSHCIEILNVPYNVSYKVIRDVFAGISIPNSSIKMIADENGKRTGVAYMRFNNYYDTYEAFKRAGSMVHDRRIEINFIGDDIYDKAVDSGKSDFSPRPPPPSSRMVPSSCLYVSALPNGSTELDVRQYLDHLTINYTEVAMEFNSRHNQPTGGAFIRLNSPNESRYALRRISNTMFRNRELRVETCPDEAMDDYVQRNMHLLKPSGGEDKSLTEDHKCLYVSNLPFGATEHDVEDLVSKYNIKATEVVLEVEKGNRQPTGGVFVPLSSLKEAQAAMKALYGVTLEGRPIKIEIRPEEDVAKAITDRTKLKINSKLIITNTNNKNEKKGRSPVKSPEKKPDVKSTAEMKKSGICGADLLTDSVVIKKVSRGISASNVRDFFSDEGLIPETIYFNNTEENDKSDIYVVFPLIENAKKALTKSGQHLGKEKVTVDLISKPDVMNAMGKSFNPLELFQKGTNPKAPPAEQQKPTTPHGGPLLPNPKIEPLMDDRSHGFGRRDGGYNSGREQYGMRNKRSDDVPPRDRSRSSQMGAAIPPDSFGQPGCVVALSNVPYSATTDDILIFFGNFISLTPESVIRRYDERNRPTADARVAFTDPEDAKRALNTLNGAYLMTRPVHLSLVN